MSQSKRWFRMYDDMLDDERIQSLTPGQFRLWVNLLALASRTSDGVLNVGGSMGFALRENEWDLDELIKELVEVGLFRRLDAQRLMPVDWHARRFPSDKSTARVRRHRADLQEQRLQSLRGVLTPDG